jgi:hydrogenase maturation protease
VPGPTPVPAPVLVVGVGSELRGDDAAGRSVADAVGRRGLAGVEVRSVHQLTPELATEWSGRRLVVVVDASVEVAAVTVRAVDRGVDGPGAMTHHLDPAALVGLAALFGAPPEEVVAVAVPAHDLRLGTELTSATLAAVDAAVAEVVERCARTGSP